MRTKRLSLKIKSGVFSIRPLTLLTLNAGGMVKLTPKKEYKAFKTDYEITGQSALPTIMIVKDDTRWFPVTFNYAKNNFEYMSDSPIPNQKDWMKNFIDKNVHIRNEEQYIEFI